MHPPTIRILARLALTCSGLLAMGQAAIAQTQYGPTPAEMAALPDYCRARIGNDPAFRQEWNQRMGPQYFEHLHHYCNGLRFMMRATNTLDSQKRRFHLQTASNEFDYVLQRWPQDFPLYALARQQKSLAQSMMGR